MGSLFTTFPLLVLAVSMGCAAGRGRSQVEKAGVAQSPDATREIKVVLDATWAQSIKHYEVLSRRLRRGGGEWHRPGGLRRADEGPPGVFAAHDQRCGISWSGCRNGIKVRRLAATAPWICRLQSVGLVVSKQAPCSVDHGRIVCALSFQRLLAERGAKACSQRKQLNPCPTCQSPSSPTKADLDL